MHIVNNRGAEREQEHENQHENTPLFQASNIFRRNPCTVVGGSKRDEESRTVSSHAWSNHSFLSKELFSSDAISQLTTVIVREFDLYRLIFYCFYFYMYMSVFIEFSLFSVLKTVYKKNN